MSKGLLLVAHGSRRKEANQELFLHLDRLKEYFQGYPMEAAFMELSAPTIEQAVKSLVESGVDHIVVLPYFLFRGMHTTGDIPRMVERAVEQHNPSVKVQHLEPVGAHPLVFDILRGQLQEEFLPKATVKDVPPHLIEEQSMSIIDSYMEGWQDIPEAHIPVVKRVIHTTGDFEYLRSLRFHPHAVEAAIDALKGGATIYTDVTMVRSGINSRYGHTVLCALNDEEAARLAATAGMTRAAAAMSLLAERLNGGVVAIGNAPTALLKLIDMIERDGIRPAIVVATPVGFVNAGEAKLRLESISSVPYITNRGFKGGSTVAAAIVNALLKMAFEQ